MKHVMLFLAMILVLGTGLAFAQRSVEVRARQPATDKKRMALVIGNFAYTRIPALRNPGNDARDMAETLKGSGFQVTLLLNAKRKEINQAIRKFGKNLRRGAVGLFYFAGHGVQVDGANYLIPIGADINEEYEVQDEAVSANRIIGMMKSAGNSLNIVFLDACRNNPYKGSFRTAARGLAAVPRTPRGSLISYATDAGAVAADGDGRNGIYTRNLLRYIKESGLELSQMMKRVRLGVERDTGGKQTPFELSSLTGDFYFRGGPAMARKQPRPAPPPRKSIDAEETLWKAIEKSKAAEDFQDYLSAYPKGRFVVTARIKIRQFHRADSRRKRRLAEEENNRREAEKGRLAEERRRLEAERRIAEDRRLREAERQRLAEQRLKRLEEEQRLADIRQRRMDAEERQQAEERRRQAALRLKKASSKEPDKDSAISDDGFWNLIRNSKKKEGFQAYLKAFPQGKHARLARIRMRQATSNQGKVALFPAMMNGFDNNSMGEPPDYILPHISSLFFSTDWNLKITHSFYPLDLQNFINLKNNKGIADNSWKGFWRKKPNPEALSRYGRQLGVNFVILHEILYRRCVGNQGRVGGNFTVHLFDVASKRLHQKKGEWICGSGYKEVADGMKALLEEKAASSK